VNKSLGPTSNKSLFFAGLRIRKAVFYVKGISSQHAVSRQDAIPDHEKYSKLGQHSLDL